MSFRAVLALGSSLVVIVVLVACGGTVSTAGDGGSDGGSGSDGGGADGGGGSCSTATLPGDRACVPPTARANVPLEIAVDAANGCLGCFTTFDPCKVDVSGSQITVTMTTKTCPPPGDQGCPAICALPGTTCKLPPLAAGKYTVKVTGDGPREGLPPRELVVVDAPTAPTSCKLPQPPNPPPPLDGTKYSTSCSGTNECRLVTVGDLCAPCHCPNAAIAVAASTYDADYRAAASQCRPTNGTVACAPCPPAAAFCKIDGTALTGTCVVQ
jgi:hypothetical protein